MALHFVMRVNGQRIGTVYIQRRETTAQRDRPNTYDVTVEYPAGAAERSEVVTHDYDDGALVLIEKALRAINRQLTPSDRRHGTCGGYTNHGCRCDACTSAIRDYARNKRALAAAAKEARRVAA